MVNRGKLDLKTITVYSRDYFNDISIQNFNVEFDNVNYQFNDF